MSSRWKEDDGDHPQGGREAVFLFCERRVARSFIKCLFEGVKLTWQTHARKRLLFLFQARLGPHKGPTISRRPSCKADSMQNENRKSASDCKLYTFLLSTQF